VKKKTRRAPTTEKRDGLSKPMHRSYHHHGGQASLADAKAKLNIHQLWTHFGFTGDSHRNPCKSPFREDRKPSFSITADGGAFHDFTTGQAGDAVTFFQLATGLSQKEACRKFIELAGGRSSTTYTAQARPVRVTPPREKPSFPAFHAGTAAEIAALARLRCISIEAVSLASERGLVVFGSVRGFPSWIVTDSAMVNAQARRLDGGTWDHLQGAKSYTLPGSWAAWPVGITESESFPNIALCEGGPDTIAAHHFMLAESRQDCAAVGVLGASQRIHAEALPMFAHKRVRIFGHDDGAGRDAVALWANQLASVGADVDAYTFTGLLKDDGDQVSDLNDCTRIHPGDFEAERSLWNLLPFPNQPTNQNR
jgi:hypothetical protein